MHEKYARVFPSPVKTTIRIIKYFKPPDHKLQKKNREATCDLKV